MERMQRAVTEALVRLEGQWKPGVKLTFIARNPGNDDADVLITSDALPEVLKLVQRRLTDDERAPAEAGRGGEG